MAGEAVPSLQSLLDEWDAPRERKETLIPEVENNPQRGVSAETGARDKTVPETFVKAPDISQPARADTSDSDAQFIELGQWVIQQQDEQSARQLVDETFEGLEEFTTKADIARYLEAAYHNDPEVQEAWDLRFEDPGRFQRVVSHLRNSLSAEIRSRPVTEARFANIRRSVTAAVLSSRTTQGSGGDNPDLSSMSGAEFERYKADLFRR